MPQIVTLPGPRDGPDTILSSRELTQPATEIAAGTKAYSSLNVLYFTGGFHDSFVNRGRIWNISPATEKVAVESLPVYLWGVDTIRNFGLIVADSPNGNSEGIWANYGELVDNDGQIFAIANGNATGITHWGSGVRLDNSGMIAAYAPAESDTTDGGIGGVGSAAGVIIYNGGLVHNRAGASILAEGLMSSTALIYSRGNVFDQGAPEIRNAGTIEAYVADPAEQSVAILTSALDHEYMRVENSGVIRAEVAYLSHSEYYSPPGGARDDITNLVGGRIYGLIDTRLGPDRLINRGLIRGDVRTGEHDDLVDTSGGVLDGRVILGWGDDRFVGGADADSVRGDRDHDRLEGGGGNDLLLGGLGDDVLIGGSGNDGLYGEYGDDRIVALGGDRVAAGAGDDIVEAGDLRFASIHGGDGFDRLVLAIGADSLDIAAARGSGRVQDIEAIETRGDQRLVLRAGDVGGLSAGEDALRLLTTATDTIELVGSWVQLGAATIDGTSFRRFKLGSEVVLVAGAADVAIGAPSAPAGGLDPVAAGGAAPLPGSVPGIALSSATTLLDNYSLNDTETVQPYEIWRSHGGEPILWTWRGEYSLINYGLMESIGPGNGGAKVIIIENVERVVNHGTMRAQASGGNPADVIVGHSSGGVTNHGLIEAITEAGDATGVTVRNAVPDEVNFLNFGTISARSNGSAKATGAFSSHGDLAFNHGTIRAVGGDGTAGVRLYEQREFVNHGTITASLAAGAGGSAAGLVYTASVWDSTYANYGLIRATKAIEGIDPSFGTVGRANLYNFGRIEGSITLASGDGWFENMGIVVGNARLGGGRNAWFGSGGEHQGSVSGGDGTDLLVGSLGADTLKGEGGNDYLRGGGAADSLSGGTGRDVFVYGAIAESTAAAFDTIADFSSGFDRIDLSALDVQSVSLTAGAGFTQLVATTAAGKLSIKVKGTIAHSDLILADRASITGTASADFLVATDGGSVVRGGSGDDILVGSADADRLEGGAGNDLAWGGAGDDVYRVTDPGDMVWEATGEGVDLIELVAPGMLLHVPDNVENVKVLVRGMVWGNDMANGIVGSSAGDSLRGGGGDDRLEGGSGDDWLFGEGGIDTARYASAGAAVAVNLALTTEQDTGGGGRDTLLEIENLIGSGFADSLTGDALANRLDGGGGADTMAGAAGDDTYVVNQGGDKVVEAADQGIDLVQSSASFTLGAHVENLILTGDAAITGTGNGLANVLTGNAAANLLNGGAGADTMAGGKGNDAYVVDQAGDAVTELAGEGTDTVQSAIGFSLAGLEVEKLVLTGADAIDGTGNALANSLTGNAAANVLNGGAGADAMAGGNGNDIYVVDDAGDAVTEAAGEGTDTVRSQVSFSLAGRHVEKLVLTGADAIDAAGNGLANTLTGNAAANRLDGGAGADAMAGGKGDDIYRVDDAGDVVTELAGQGADMVESAITCSLAGLQVEKLTLTGGAAIDGTGNSGGNVLTGNGAANRLVGDGGGDRISGGGSGDSLSGGTGNDRLYGGAGHDSLRGGADADGFYFDAPLSAASNVDAILDFSAASDTIFLDRNVFAAIGAAALGPGAFRAGAAALDADDRILYQSSTGKIFYDADGAGGAAAVLFATVAAGTALSHADFTIYG